MRFPFSSPTDWQTTKATASASVSRTCLVVRVRRSPRCSISWPISCTSVENSSAGCIPESSVIFPPCEKPLAGPIFSEITKLDALRFDELEQPFAVSADVALDFGQRGKFFAFGLADVLSRDLRPSLCAPDRSRL